MIVSIVMATVMTVVTFVFHYRLLLWLAVYLPFPAFPANTRVFFIVMVLFLAHIVEIGFYGAAYSLSIGVFGLGELKGMSIGDPMEYFYFSSVIYTSLGIGDIHPTGHIRFLTGIEALNGLMLIAWSASFAFLAMGRLWPWTECCDNEDDISEK